MSYGDSLSYSSTTTYTAPSNSKTGFEQIEKLDREDIDLKWQIAMLSVRVHKFEQKTGRKIDFDKKESARFNMKKTDHDGESDGVIAFKKFGMIAGCDTKDAIEEGTAKIYNLITGADTEEASTAGDAGEFALMRVTSEFVLQAVLLRAGKVNIPLARPQPVPTGGKETFGGGEGRITGKRTIQTSTLDFENVYYVKELQQFNLFSIS
nr:ribonuclease H-like domain-containing protein [Tanacetum cinerariifolium]